MWEKAGDFLELQRCEDILDELYEGRVTLKYKCSEDKAIFVGLYMDQQVVVKFLKRCDFNIDLKEELLKLNHAYLAQYYDIAYNEEHVVVIREYIRGRTLYELVDENGPLDEASAKRLTKKIAEALTYLHEGQRKMIFRDLHPKNIIVNQYNEPILIDLVTMRAFDAEKHSDTTVIGSLGFIAPEQFGYNQSSEKSDMYALGAIMYYSLTDKLPKGDLSDINEYSVTQNTRKLIKKMLSFSPSKRYSSLHQVMKKLDPVYRPYSIKSFLLGLILGGFIVGGLSWDLSESQTKSIKDENGDLVLEDRVGEGLNDFEDALVTVRPYSVDPSNAIEAILIKNDLDLKWEYIESVVGINTVNIRNFSVYKYDTEENYYIRVDYEMTKSDKYMALFFAEDYPGLKAFFEVDSKLGQNTIIVQFNKSDFQEVVWNIPQESRLLAINLYPSGEGLQALFIPIDEILDN